MTDLLVYVHAARADAARALVGAACTATGVGVRMEVFGGSGSLYQRLGARRAPPPPDLVWFFGPFAAHAAASDGFLLDARWNPVEYSAIGVVGAPPMAGWQDVTATQRLAVADPERSEMGLAILLSTLDRARQTDGDVEAGWRWWQERFAAGLVLAEDEAGAVASVQSGAATHALMLSDSAAAVDGLAPIPHAVGVAANSRNAEAAAQLLDWLAGRAAPPAPPALDVDWATSQYVTARQRWAESGFAP